MISNKKNKEIFDIAIIGGGPAGLAAANRCAELGIKNTVLIERDFYLGGILPQCIHGGFGLKIFKKELTGPEYNQIFVDRLKKSNVIVMLNTMALWLRENIERKSMEKQVFEITLAGKDRGFEVLKARALILALGCRERTRGQTMIDGTRPAGVFTAGLVQRMVNIEGYLPGKEIVILGSGDIGLIMARRLTLEGCRVKGVFELMPFSTGLLRNISQCLEDYGIPLYLSHTVTDISGNKRVDSIEVCSVDSELNPVKSSARIIKCDTLLLSVGLIPENELSKTCGIAIDKNTGGPIINEDFQTSVPGIFSCGNSLFVYDLVDNVTEDGFYAAESAVSYLSCMNSKGESFPEKVGSAFNNIIDVLPGENVAYVVPQKIMAQKDISFKIRVKIPVRNATVKISGTDYKKKIKHINPGELILLNIDRKIFEPFFGTISGQDKDQTVGKTYNQMPGQTASFNKIRIDINGDGQA